MHLKIYVILLVQFLFLFYFWQQSTEYRIFLKTAHRKSNSKSNNLFRVFVFKEIMLKISDLRRSVGTKQQAMLNALP